jgi:hypothetical protein
MSPRGKHSTAFVRSHATNPPQSDRETVAQEELSRSSYSEVRQIRCHWRNGVLSLHGRVSRFYLKQIAQTLVLQQLEGVALENCVEVVDR